MKAKHKMPGVVTEAGVLEIDRAKFQEHISNLAGKEIWLGIEANTDLRISSHRGYYFASLVPDVVRALIEAGNEFEEGNHDHETAVHKWLEETFLDNRFKVKTSKGNTVTMSASVGRLDDDGWQTYFRKITIFVAEKMNYDIKPKQPKGYFPENETK